MQTDTLKIVECPRDAMQGLHDFIPTPKKIDYLQSLLKVGFDTLDAGSFVSPRAIPQLQDTAEVISSLDLSATKSKLLTIVANQRGGEEAVKFDQITYLGYPFSISEEFQKRNTNKSIEESEGLVQDLVELCDKHKKELVVYISMGFGNPYGEEWNVNIVEDWSSRLAEKGVKILSLSDTVGTSNPESITYLFSNLIPALPQVEFGAHLHTTPSTWHEKIDAAYKSGCRRFDGAIKGFGGCPMAKDDLTGNMPTEAMLAWFDAKNIDTGINSDSFLNSLKKAVEVFP